MMTYFVLILQFVCLSMWIGGSTAIVLIVAPSLFRKTSLRSSGTVMGLIMRRYVGLLAMLQVILLATLYLQLLVLSDSLNLKLRLALSFTSLATLLTVYLRFTMLPRIEGLRLTLPDSEPNELDSEHTYLFRRSQGRSMVALATNLFLGLCVVITLILPF